MNLNHYSLYDDNSPLKVKVYNFISSEINNSHLKIGNYLPSMRTFAETLGVSCHVIHIAVRELANQGILSQCENGRYIISCKDVPIARKHCRVGLCSHGHQVIRHPMYQGVANQLQAQKRSEYELDCILSLKYAPEQIADGYYDVLLSCDWLPADAKRICKGKIIGLDIWYDQAKPHIYIKPDHHRGGEMAGAFLYNCGYRRVAYFDIITSKARLLSAMPMRYLGFMKGFIESGAFVDDVIYCPELDDYAHYDNSVRNLLETQKVDCIFAATDNYAIKLYYTLKACGYKVPEDCGLMGYDGDFEALSNEVSITTMAQPVTEIATQIWSAIAYNRFDRNIVIAPSLIRGSSTLAG